MVGFSSFLKEFAYFRDGLDTTKVLLNLVFSP